MGGGIYIMVGYLNFFIFQIILIGSEFAKLGSKLLSCCD